MFGKKSYGLFEEYKTQDVETVFVAMRSIVGPIKDAVDELRNKGEKIGVGNLTCKKSLVDIALAHRCAYVVTALVNLPVVLQNKVRRALKI